MHCVVIATLKRNRLNKDSGKEQGIVQQLLEVKMSAIIIIWMCLQRVNILNQNLLKKEMQEEIFSQRYVQNAKGHFGTNLSDKQFNYYEC